MLTNFVVNLKQQMLFLIVKVESKYVDNYMLWSTGAVAVELRAVAQRHCFSVLL